MDLARIDRYFDAVARHFDLALDGRLSSAHKIGSLAHGGFSPEYSDIDLALILKSEPPDGVMDRAIASARSLDPELGARLSVFWSDLRFEFGRFPILDRADLIDHAVRICGDPIGDVSAPPLAEVRDYLMGHPLEYWSEKTARFQGAHSVPAEERKEFVRCLLYPARLLYTWDTGKLTSNDEAVAHLRRRRSVDGLSLFPIEQALGCRNGSVSFESLLRHADQLVAQRAATLAELQRGDA